MKKITLLLAAVLSLSAFAQVTVTKNWERSDSLATRHIWNTGDNTRGIAFGTMGVNDRVFLATRSTTGGQVARIVVLNAATGDSISVMNMSGVTGGTHAISDAGMTEDGVLLVSNLQTAVSSTAPLKIYKWVNETTAPTVAVQWAPTVAEGRYGDKITVAGKVSDGTARIYAVKNINGTANIKYWDMTADTNNPGSYVFNQEPKDLFTVPNLGVLASVGLRPDGGLYYKVNGAQIKQYAANGTVVGGDSPGTVIPANANNVKYVADDNQGNPVVAYLRYRVVGTATSQLGEHRVDFVRVVGNDLVNSVIVANTPSLGKTANGNGAGGLHTKKLANNDVELYMLSTNNGIAKFTISGLLTVVPTSVKNTSTDLMLVKSGQQLRVEDVIPTSMIIYNVAGQKLQAVANSNTISVEGLKGVHIVKMNVNGKTHTQKVVL